MNRAVSFTNLIRMTSPDVIRNRLTLEFGKKIGEVCCFFRSRLGYTATIFRVYVRCAESYFMLILI